MDKVEENEDSERKRSIVNRLEKNLREKEKYEWEDIEDFDGCASQKQSSSLSVSSLDIDDFDGFSKQKQSSSFASSPSSPLDGTVIGYRTTFSDTSNEKESPTKSDNGSVIVINSDDGSPLPKISKRSFNGASCLTTSNTESQISITSSPGLSSLEPDNVDFFQQQKEKRQ